MSDTPIKQLPENFYQTLQQKDKDIVIRRLQYKCLMDWETYLDSKYDVLCQKYLCDQNKDYYILRTRWHITSSKIKSFIKSEEEYHIRYVLELPELEPKEKKCLLLWNAFDTLVSKWVEEFNNKYYTDKWYVKAELATLIANRDGWDAKKIEKDNTLDQLRDKRYKAWDKIRLTPGEWKDVMWMYREYKRQQMLDPGTGYEWHYYCEATYKSLTLSWTLDRFNKEKCLIRDSKTAWRIERIERDIENTFDYIMQMATYHLLIYLQEWVECDVLLDIVWSSFPYQSIVYRMDKNKLRRKLNNEIIPALDRLDNCYETNQRKTSSRIVAMESPYYPIMEWSIITELIDSN